MALIVAGQSTRCDDCGFTLTGCPSCGLDRCQCRPAGGVDRETVRYVHWKDGVPFQESVEAASRRRATPRPGYCSMCNSHKASHEHRHECAAGREERAAAAKAAYR